MSDQHEGHEGELLLLSRAHERSEERYLQADLAGMVHLLEQAYSTASTAHDIACRRRRKHPVLGDPINSVQIAALDQIVASSKAAAEGAKLALQDSVAASPHLFKRYR